MIDRYSLPSMIYLSKQIRFLYTILTIESLTKQPIPITLKWELTNEFIYNIGPHANDRTPLELCKLFCIGTEIHEIKSTKGLILNFIS